MKASRQDAAPGDHHVRCDGPHGPSCPAWCALRPGGATRRVPAMEGHATTLMPDEYPEPRDGR